MKAKNIQIFPALSFPVALATQALVLALASIASAADGTWTQTNTGGSWNTAGNWLGAIVADGSGFTANFNTLDITADNTVHLDGDHTLTSLTFGDTSTSSAAGWVLDNNNTTTNNLILAGTTPTITVNLLGTGKAVEISAVIEGAGLTKAGTGTLILSTANTYTGGTTIGVASDVGIVQITNASGFGTGTVAIRPGSTSGAARLNLEVTLSGVGSSVSNPNVIPNAFDLGGTGTSLLAGGFGYIQNISGYNKITGNITRRNTGGSFYNIVSAANTLELAGTLSSAVTTTRAFNFGGAGDILVSGAIVNGVSMSTTQVAKDGMGTLTLTNTNTYTGTTTVNDGLLLTTKAASLAGYTVSSRIIFNGGTVGVQVGGVGWTTAEVDTLLTNAIKTSGTLGIDTTNGNLTQWTAFTTTNLGNNLGLNKLGSNTLTLDQANTYAGATIVTAGRLVVNGSSSTGSTLSVSSGASLAGTGTIGGSTTIQSGGKYSPGAVGAVGNQNFSNNLTFDSGSIFEWDLTSASIASGFDTITGAAGKTFAASGNFRVVTDLDFSTGNFWQTNKIWNSIFNSFGTTTGWSAAATATVFTSAGVLRDVSSYGSFSITGSTLTFTAVPEPTNALAGILVTAGLLRRRRSTHIPG